MAGWLLASAGWGCHGNDPPEKAEAAGAAEAPDLPDPAWVRVYDPREAENGYTLTLHRRRTPVLLDMNGRTVHAWPEVRMKSRVRLLPDGSILGLGLGRQVEEYSWEGEKTWEYRVPGAFPHHDVQRLANGNTLLIIKAEGEAADTLIEVDREKNVVRTFEAAEALKAFLPEKPRTADDVTHINSVQELPENPHFRSGDERFRPGNLLISARNLDTIFVLDRRSGEVLWSYRDGLDHQHEPQMNGPGEPYPGRILLFNNRRRSFFRDRGSEILELDPRSGAVTWRFRTPGFFTGTGGTQQGLANGNVLVTSTRGRRVFEVTRQGEIVWQWAPPYQAVRALRLGPDASSRLPSLRARRTHAVEAPPGYRHIDPESYRFARRGSRTQVEVAGQAREVLKEGRECRRLLLPTGARAELGFGVHRQRWKQARPAPEAVTFTVSLRPLAAAAEEPAEELLRETIGRDGEAWRRRTLPLEAYGLREVELCLELEGGDQGETPVGDRFAFWEQPSIHQGSPDDPAEDAPPADLTAEELKVRREHLKSLGYVD